MHCPRGAAVLLFGCLIVGLATLSPPSCDAVHGIVTSDAGPVAGAIVRWQGATDAAHTDEHGRFKLSRARRQHVITAAKPGFLIAAGSPPRLHLAPVPDDDNDDYAWIDPTPDPGHANNCGNCHTQIHDAWTRSAHAGAAKNPKFLHLFAGTDGHDGSGPPAATWNLQAEHPLGSGVCAACHAPTLTSPELDYDVRQARGVHRHGVHCDYCHKIADAPVDKLGTRFGRDGYRLARPRGGEQLFFGPLDDAVRAGESFAYAPFYKDSRYCASCHEGVIFGVHVYGTYSEWLASPARRDGKHCQDCHMTPTGTMTNIAPGKGGVKRDPRTLASHHFPGAAELLRSCVQVKTAVARTGAGITVTVTTVARNAGHRVPTGFIDRHLVLIVEGRDGDGRVVAASAGPVLPERAGAAWVGKSGWIYGKQHVSAAGRPLPFWLSAAELIDTRLVPERPDQKRFSYPACVQTIRVRMVYRRFWDEVAVRRKWQDNEILVSDESIRAGDDGDEPP
ncbi:MAG: cytochrome c family protein [Gemmataceae bacterium]|nr:cytochrome c family protein [Gemmataceae bacterium]